MALKHLNNSWSYILSECPTFTGLITEKTQFKNAFALHHNHTSGAKTEQVVAGGRGESAVISKGVKLVVFGLKSRWNSTHKRIQN